MLGHQVARHLDKPYDSIPSGLRKIMLLYDIGENDWKALAKAGVTDVDGVKLLMPDAIRALEPFKGQRALEQKFRTYIIDNVYTAVPRPGARERAIVLQGTQAGTPEGEAFRMMAQFKMFTTTMLTKVYPNLMNDGMPGVLHLALMMTAFGYAANSVKDILGGREPGDPLDAGTWTRALTAGGGMGILGDILLNDFNEYGRGLTSVVVGPGIGAVADVGRIVAGVARGKDESAKAFRLTMSNMPFANLFYTKPAIDYLWTYQIQEWLNPGYLRRMERRVRANNRRDFLIRPSEIIPRGGGLR